MAASTTPRLGDPLETGVVAGERLGNYEILKRLATGGMAEIFLARIRKMNSFQKIVVIKRILPQLAQHTEFVEMFLDEARIAATLEHPNIVQTHDVGVLDGNFYIAMEYLHGEDLRAIMSALRTRNRKLPLELALHIVISAAAGLHYAHEKVGFDGEPLLIVHRDVSPQNLIVTYEGGVKLLDFGIAKASNRLRETRIGTLKGKVPYMSPEQCRSEALDRRSDVFSLGILLYELTLTRRLYPGSSDFEVLKEIVEGRVTPPIELDPNYPPALNAIVLRALEKQPDQRWQSARELQAELEKMVRQERLTATPTDLQEFVGELFGHKIEAWREAQARGKTLDEHLLALEHDDNLDTEDIEIDSPQMQRARAEREAFLAKIISESGKVPSLRPRRGRWLVLLLALAASGAGAYFWPFGVPTSLPSSLGGATPGPASETQTPEPALAPPAQQADHAPRARELSVPTVNADPKLPPRHEERPANAPVVALPRPPIEPAEPLRGVGSGGSAEAPTVDAPSADAPSEEPANDELDPPGRRGVKRGHHPPTVTAKPNPHAKPVVAPGRHSGGTAQGGTAQDSAKTQEGASGSGGPVTSAPAKLEGEGTLMVATSPWCRVVVDGSERGNTPLKLKLPAGPHTILMVNPEFHINREITVTIHANEETRKRLDFTD